MSEKISLKEAERKVFRTTFQDGLWDVLIGCFLLQFVIAPSLSPSLGDFWSSAVFLPFWALAICVIWLLRKHAVTPRIGVVKFGPARKTRMIKFNVVILITLTMTLFLGLLASINWVSVTGMVYSAVFGLITLMGFSIAAYFLDFPRLYAYGILIALAPLAGEWLYVNMKVPHHGFPVTFGFISAICILIGLSMFFRFLRAYPMPTNDVVSEGQKDD